MVENFGAKYVWMDDKLVEWERAQVHVLTHALHYGTGVFEGIRGYWNGSQLYIFRLEDHVKRLLNSAKIYGFDPKYGIEGWSKAIIETVKANELRCNVYIRPLLIVGYGFIGLSLKGHETQAIVIALPFEKYFEKPGVDVMVSTWRRISEMSNPPTAKVTGHYTNSVMAKMEALRNGYDEAILLDLEGHVSEGSGENIFLIRNGVVYTPPLSSGILEGITRDSVIKIAEDMGYQVVEREISRTELYLADEAFFSGTAAEITAILSVDRKPIGDGKIGPITRSLKEKYERVVKGLEPKYKGWLTPVY
jgi:branched-chain amino acid aminotransferase